MALLENAAAPASDNDLPGAFCPHGRFELPGAAEGPLKGWRFAVKDLIDIAGRRTGAGNLRWLETHMPAERTASCVQCLLDAGARMIGKTVTDELAYSLNGENLHYGAPLNSRAPDRVPGGSSSGSAAARAQRQDIAALIYAILSQDALLCLPTAPGPVPLLAAPEPAVEKFRQRAQRLTCIAGIAGLPQVSIPGGEVDRAPVGLSLIGPRGSDEALLALGVALSKL